MNENAKPVEKFTDIELAELLNNNYQELSRIQNNILAINSEVMKRKNKKPTE